MQVAFSSQNKHRACYLLLLLFYKTELSLRKMKEI